MTGAGIQLVTDDPGGPSEVWAGFSLGPLDLGHGVRLNRMALQLFGVVPDCVSVSVVIPVVYNLQPQVKAFFLPRQKIWVIPIKQFKFLEPESSPILGSFWPLWTVLDVFWAIFGPFRAL